MHQRNIYHRHLINNDHICFQRIFEISVKMNSSAFLLSLRHTIQFQKTMDRLCFISGSFCHSLGSTARRSCKAKFCSFFLKIADNCVNGSCFSCSRASRQNKQAVLGSRYHCLFLHFIQLGSCLFLNSFNPFLDHVFILRAENIQFTQHPCRIQFQVIITFGINDSSLFRFLKDQFPFHDHIHQVLLHIRNIYSQKPGRSGKKLFLWKINVALPRSL